MAGSKKKKLLQGHDGNQSLLKLEFRREKKKNHTGCIWFCCIYLSVFIPFLISPLQPCSLLLFISKAYNVWLMLLIYHLFIFLSIVGFPYQPASLRLILSKSFVLYCQIGTFFCPTGHRTPWEIFPSLASLLDLMSPLLFSPVHL